MHLVWKCVCVVRCVHRVALMKNGSPALKLPISFLVWRVGRVIFLPTIINLQQTIKKATVSYNPRQKFWNHQASRKVIQLLKFEEKKSKSQTWHKTRVISNGTFWALRNTKKFFKICCWWVKVICWDQAKGKTKLKSWKNNNNSNTLALFHCRWLL